LLKEIGQLIRSMLRGNDLAYRAGGDEFVILLHGCDRAAGTAVARRLETLVKSLTKLLVVRNPPQLSIGIAAVSELRDQTGEALIQLADGRLYAVKAKRPGTRRSA
jgi:diguanylate cyclase (GGDEF)-like protein